MRTVGLIAVRMKSSRLKQKALLDLNGKPLILHLLTRVRSAMRIDEVVLCTSIHPDDGMLLKIAEENGFRYFAGSEVDIIDRFVSAGEAEGADIIVRITGDNPLTDPGVTDRLIESHIAVRADYTRMDNLPIGITPEVITFSAMKTLYEKAEDTSYSEYLTCYFLDHPEVFKINVLQAPDDLSRPDYRLTVDYAEDYMLIKAIFWRFRQLRRFEIKDVIKFLDAHPDIAAINSQTPPARIPPTLNTRLKAD